MKKWLVLILFIITVSQIWAREYHVSPEGDDLAKGTPDKPLRTISRAAQHAHPGDVITVHEGTYREQIVPPRGGQSDAKRITYQAAENEKVTIKGSEVITGWNKVQNDTWKVIIPNSFFGAFNPYDDLIRGDWFNKKGRSHHTGAVYLNEHWLTEAAKLEEVMNPTGQTPLWFGQVDGDNTTVWAQFKEVNPNKADVEINVRQSIFYPEKTGMNYITVRGFTMMHAATPWAPPTTEQVGLIGTHWSKGWIIENNDIRYSVCTGITLGKYGDEYDNTSQNSAKGYVKTIERGLAQGWSKENVGGHIVRNNRIAHCEQAGIVGSLGAVFSTVTGNEIHDIHTRRLFGGAEMAGIKFHAPIDSLIARNHIYRCVQGIWLDWMTQGTRVTQNLLYDNIVQDLFVEVNHGPFLIDNNICLSRTTSLTDLSQGGAYVHNLFSGRFHIRNELNRETPYHLAHSTEVAGFSNIKGGDNRFFNNIFVGTEEFALYHEHNEFPAMMAGNVFLKGALPCSLEKEPLVINDFDPAASLIEKDDGVYLQITLDSQWADHKRQLVTSELLGRAKIPNLPWVQTDDSPYRIDGDYFGSKRNPGNPFPGPFETTKDGKLVLKVWPH